MSTDNEKLSPQNSPNTVIVQKKRARRLNDLPLFITIVVVGIILATICLVMMQRGEAARADAPDTGGKSSAPYARDVIGQGGGGVVPPKMPDAPDIPNTPPPDTGKKPDIGADKKEAVASQNARQSEPPRISEEMRKAREKRLRLAEAAIDGPIKVQIEEVRAKPRSLDAEIAEVERQIAALGGQGGNTYAERLASLKTAAEGGIAEIDYSRRGDLSRMNQFAAINGNWRNPAQIEKPATPYIIRTGSVIPATLVGGINSDLPGQIIGQVSQDVFDTPTGKHVLIPQGSRLIGEYSSQIQYGQSRVFAIWQRIVFPDGRALDLGAMPGSSGAGYAGFSDWVNNHFPRIFGSAIMMSAILAGVEMTQSNRGFVQGSNQQRMSDALSESLGQVLGGVIGEMLQRNMSIAPTLEIRPGYRLNVMLVKDLEFTRPYRSFDFMRQ